MTADPIPSRDGISQRRGNPARWTLTRRETVHP